MSQSPFHFLNSVVSSLLPPFFLVCVCVHIYIYKTSYVFYVIGILGDEAQKMDISAKDGEGED